MRDQAPVNLHGFLLGACTCCFSVACFCNSMNFSINFLGHRRRRIAAVAAMFDQHGDRDLRRLHRRVGNKPGVIAGEIGSAVRS